MNTILGTKEIEALRTYRDAHGNRWRHELAKSWREGGDHGQVLQALRNRIGPSGLAKLTGSDISEAAFRRAEAWEAGHAETVKDLCFLLKDPTGNRFRILSSPEPIPVTVFCHLVKDAIKDGFTQCCSDVDVVSLDPADWKKKGGA